jgi:serine/threonine-protein kinase
VPDPTEIAPERGIPEPLVRVVRKALEKNAGDRYQDALEFAEALGEAMLEIESSTQSVIASMRPGGAVECPACLATVPAARFCCDCGEKLTTRDERPTSRLAPDLPELPLRLYAREEDLAWLEAARKEDSPALRAYRIVGDAGIGKTRLLREFLERAKMEGDVVIEAGPDPYGAEVAFYTLRQAIYGLIGVKAGTGSRRQWRDAREEEQRGLNDIFGSADKSSVPPAQRKDDIDAAFRWALDRATARARNSRVILAVEDLERVDTASLGALRHALRHYRSPRPALCIATHSPVFDPMWGSSSARTLSGLPASVLARVMGSRPSAERLSL